MEKDTPYLSNSRKKDGVAILIPDNVDFIQSKDCFQG